MAKYRIVETAENWFYIQKKAPLFNRLFVFGTAKWEPDPVNFPHTYNSLEAARRAVAKGSDRYGSEYPKYYDAVDSNDQGWVPY